MKELLEKMKNVGGVGGVVVVKSDDGSRVESAGDVSSILDDISAFVGSCGDVISKLLKLNGFINLKLRTKNADYLIFPKDDLYIGLSLNDKSDIDGIEGTVVGMLQKNMTTDEEEEKPPAQEKTEVESVLNVSPNIKKFIESKVLQINYLIDEFSQGGIKDDWLHNVIYSLKTIDKEEKMSKALVEENDKVKLYLERVSNDINENEISVISKGIIDELCKLAVRRFGTDETKKKIQNVIKKITKSRVG